ncbi:IclR family transcriptional regulator [Pseudooceanicola sp. CBS1P-1]|uniref:Helix-turn-helix domain-containing protein n=1 Tax=Pseudooceanicola albus TaxID=2692189 RepID=A0A6L7G430_9RHOB|nr:MULTISPECIES: IclR family transcriptional regulator [Pseudooceanicola]MBT9385380.1 IclR family transcriptional regulator [Pseudooceanicola endophyticus]MXN18761.1 helix-turn-helix domain-containing protein [Pseudooceanicola albus]
MEDQKSGYQAPAPLKTKGVEAVYKALRILSLFDSSSKRLTLGDISQRTGLVKSSVLRLLVSLQSAGYLRMTPDKAYVVGPEAFRVGRIYQSTFNLEGEIRPVLKRLVAATGESASFFRREGQKRVCLYREDTNQLLREHIAEGDAVDIDKGAPSHVFIEYDMMRGDQPAPLDILEELPVISIGERGPGIAGLSVPIFGADGDMLGALTVSGPASRLTAAKIDEIQPLLMNGAATCCASLGARFYELWEGRL